MRLEVTLSVPERAFKRTRVEERAERRLTRERVLRSDKDGRPLALRRIYIKQELSLKPELDAPLERRVGALEGRRLMISRGPTNQILVTDLDALEVDDRDAPKPSESKKPPPDPADSSKASERRAEAEAELAAERLYDPALNFLPTHLVSPGESWEIPEHAIHELLGEALPKGLKVRGLARFDSLDEIESDPAGPDPAARKKQRVASLSLDFQAKTEGARLEMRGLFKISLTERRPLELRMNGRIESQEVEAANDHRRVLDASLTIAVSKLFQRASK
jgi:hypothetical protein